MEDLHESYLCVETGAAALQYIGEGAGQGQVEKCGEKFKSKMKTRSKKTSQGQTESEKL